MHTYGGNAVTFPFCMKEILVTFEFLFSRTIETFKIVCWDKLSESSQYISVQVNHQVHVLYSNVTCLGRKHKKLVLFFRKYSISISMLQ